MLAILQSLGVASFVFQQGIVVTSSFEFHVSTVVSLVTGTMFLMWLGEQITERGIGNGISLIITAGIASGIPSGYCKAGYTDEPRFYEHAYGVVYCIWCLIINLFGCIL